MYIYETKKDGQTETKKEGITKIFFLLFVFAFVEFTPFTACVSKPLEALLSRKHRLFRFEPHYISCVPVSQDKG